jgi:hypothetical protein
MNGGLSSVRRKAVVSLLAVVAVLVATVAAPSLASGGVATPLSIDDNFTGTSIDYAHVWDWWGTNQPDFVSFSQGRGTLNVDVSGGAQPDFNVSGQTRCLAHGNFDARIDFNLAHWPPQNGVTVSLMVGGTPFNVYRVSWQFEQSEAYGTYLPPAGGTLPATGTSGTLRLTRFGDIFTGWYLAGRNWVPIASGVGPTDDVPLTIAVFNISGAATFAGLPVTVAFDNFHVRADQVICP